MHILTQANENGLSVAPYVWILSGAAVEMVLNSTFVFLKVLFYQQLISRVQEGVPLPQLPRLLGVYPTMSTTPQLDHFADVWRGYGSAKQLQVVFNLHMMYL